MLTNGKSVAGNRFFECVPVAIDRADAVKLVPLADLVAEQRNRLNGRGNPFSGRPEDQKANGVAGLSDWVKVSHKRERLKVGLTVVHLPTRFSYFPKNWEM